MTRRYFVPDLPALGGPLALPDAEAQHAVRVMRVQVGDWIELFNGAGHESLAQIIQVSRSACQCVAEPSRPIDREPSVRLKLGIALPKPDRAKELIERLTELGVHSVTPLVADRSQRPPSESTIEKLSRTVIEASKQCGRNQLMQIGPPIVSRAFFAAAKGDAKWIAHQAPGTDSPAGLLAGSSIVAAVGPEGGWTEEELQAALEHGFSLLDLGPRIYRIETAAVVIAAKFTVA